MRKTILVLGLVVWAAGSVFSLGYGIHLALAEQSTATATVITSPVATVSLPIETQPVLVLVPAVEKPIVQATATVGSGCVRASFTVVP